MDARTTRRISQRDSRYCGCIKPASLNEKPGRGATITACADPPAQRISDGFTSFTPLRSQSERHHLRRSTRTSIAANLVRGQIKNPVGSRPLRLHSFTRDQLLHPAIFTLGNLAAEQ